MRSIDLFDPTPPGNSIEERRERARLLIEELNRQAGDGRVVSGLAQVLIYCMANSRLKQIGSRLPLV